MAAALTNRHDISEPDARRGLMWPLNKQQDPRVVAAKQVVESLRSPNDMPTASEFRRQAGAACVECGESHFRYLLQSFRDIIFQRWLNVSSVDSPTCKNFKSKQIIVHALDMRRWITPLLQGYIRLCKTKLSQCVQHPCVSGSLVRGCVRAYARCGSPVSRRMEPGRSEPEDAKERGRQAAGIHSL